MPLSHKLLRDSRLLIPASSVYSPSNKEGAHGSGFADREDGSICRINPRNGCPAVCRRLHRDRRCPGAMVFRPPGEGPVALPESVKILGWGTAIAS
ncbi:hypothetical protein AJ87_14260 [Rhizobium yanglingense]|nr:hypothetical protein AJ87_14260 [Rhizobium yanglingense]